MEKKLKIEYIAGLVLILLTANACQDIYPKPHAYPRVIYPKKEYQLIDINCPFQFEIPTYSKLIPYSKQDDNCWYNLSYPQFDATLHLSYVPVNEPLEIDSLTEDAYRMVFKPHLQRAEEIIEREISDTTVGIYGMIYDLEGKTATPFNFYITDGKKHFFRGSFYFNGRTSRDSIQPVYEFINEDVIRTIETFTFR